MDMNIPEKQVLSWFPAYLENFGKILLLLNGISTTWNTTD